MDAMLCGLQPMETTVGIFSKGEAVETGTIKSFLNNFDIKWILAKLQTGQILKKLNSFNSS